MKRRTLLKRAAVGSAGAGLLAGCVSRRGAPDGAPGDPTEETTTDEPTTTGAETTSEPTTRTTAADDSDGDSASESSGDSGSTSGDESGSSADDGSDGSQVDDSGTDSSDDTSSGTGEESESDAGDDSGPDSSDGSSDDSGGDSSDDGSDSTDDGSDSTDQGDGSDSTGGSDDSGSGSGSGSSGDDSGESGSRGEGPPLADGVRSRDIDSQGRCLEAGESAGKAGVSFDGDRVAVGGAIQTPDPCFRAHVAASSYDGRTYEVVIEAHEMTDENGDPVVCQQCVGILEYDATVTFGDPPDRVVVKHGPETVADERR